MGLIAEYHTTMKSVAVGCATVNARNGGLYRFGNRSGHRQPYPDGRPNREHLNSAAGSAVLGANALALAGVTLSAAAGKLREGPSMRSTMLRVRPPVRSQAT
jgi:hypothetical protein